MRADTSVIQSSADRQPDWRHHRVMELCEHRPRPARCASYDDERIVKAREFLLLYRVRSGAARTALHNPFHGLYHAYQLRLQLNSFARMRIEARLLARQPFDEVGKACGIAPSVVEWYEALFFNITDRIEARDWIHQAILGPAALRSLVDQGRELSTKMFAYHGGPVLLEFLLTTFKDPTGPTVPEEINDYVDRYWTSGVKARSALSLATMEVNSQNIMSLFNLNRQIIVDTRNANTPAEAKSAYEKNINEFVKRVAFSIGSDGEKQIAATSPKLADFDKSARELRDYEMLAVANGELDDELERQKNIPFRRPEAKTEEKERA